METRFDKVAKLLANENLQVVRAPVKTASFDVKNRTLTLPQWKDMTDEIETMLIGHEVGHALFTDESIFEELKASDVPFGYLNIIEDARIEKLMKRRYPGLRKDFNTGYRELNDRDFFGLKNKETNSMMLIDRINLYFKLGYASRCEFTAEEKVFLRDIEKAESIAEVVEIAKRVYEYTKLKEAEKVAEMEAMDLEYGDQDAEEEFDDEYDDTVQSAPNGEDGELSEEEGDGQSGSYRFEESEEDGEQRRGADNIDNVEDREQIETQSNMEQNSDKSAGDYFEESNDQSDSVEVPQTQKAMDEFLEELADTDIEYRYFTIDDNYITDVLVDYKQVLTDTAHVELQDNKEFFLEMNRVVNYLVKEFEMKKAATLYKRSTIARSGSLDMTKLYGYKLNDDLFKRMTVLPEGKNHGMVFLLDWSGSMFDVIRDTVKQLVTLVTFCRRVNIPFEVYAFTNQYRRKDFTHEVYEQVWEKERAAEKNRMIANNEGAFSMLQLFSSSMTNSEHVTLSKRILSDAFYYNPDYSLGGTPLNEALLWMMKRVPQFKTKFNVERLSFITLTDGAGNTLGRYRSDYWDSSLSKRIKVKNFIADPVTKKSYKIDYDATQQTLTLLEMLKDKTGCELVGFYVCKNKKRDLMQAIFYNSNVSHYWTTETMIPEVRKDIRSDGFFSISGTIRDEMFVVASTSMKTDKGDEIISGDLTARQIASRLSKNLKKQRTSRILLDRFIAAIA